MNADNNNPGLGATGYPNEGWRFYMDEGKLSGIVFLESDSFKCEAKLSGF